MVDVLKQTSLKGSAIWIEKACRPKKHRERFVGLPFLLFISRIISWFPHGLAGILLSRVTNSENVQAFSENSTHSDKNQISWTDCIGDEKGRPDAWDRSNCSWSRMMRRAWN